MANSGTLRQAAARLGAFTARENADRRGRAVMEQQSDLQASHDRQRRVSENRRYPKKAHYSFDDLALGLTAMDAGVNRYYAMHAGRQAKKALDYLAQATQATNPALKAKAAKLARQHAAEISKSIHPELVDQIEARILWEEGHRPETWDAERNAPRTARPSVNPRTGLQEFGFPFVNRTPSPSTLAPLIGQTSPNLNEDSLSPGWREVDPVNGVEAVEVTASRPPPQMGPLLPNDPYGVFGRFQTGSMPGTGRAGGQPFQDANAIDNLWNITAQQGHDFSVVRPDGSGGYEPVEPNVVIPGLAGVKVATNPQNQTPTNLSTGIPMAVDLGIIGKRYLDSGFAEMFKNFDQYARDRGVSMRYSSGYRTPEKQADIRNSGKGITPAKSSLHSAGLAIDVDRDWWKDLAAEDQAIIKEAAQQAGLSWGGKFRDPDDIHFYYDPRTNRVELINNFGARVSTLPPLP